MDSSTHNSFASKLENPTIIYSVMPKSSFYDKFPNIHRSKKIKNLCCILCKKALPWSSSLSQTHILCFIHYHTVYYIICFLWLLFCWESTIYIAPYNIFPSFWSIGFIIHCMTYNKWVGSQQHLSVWYTQQSCPFCFMNSSSCMLVFCWVPGTLPVRRSFPFN